MKKPSSLHPAIRFQAPGSIPRGTPLKDVLGRNVIALIAESFAGVSRQFDVDKFIATASAGLEPLALTARAQHIARALSEQLPERFDAACKILLASFGPELTKTEGNGLATFYYMPHMYVIAERGINNFDAAMRANYELTKRFTAEFSIRPFLAKYRDASLQLLEQWAVDNNPHVRRLVSEGTRPRLPWAMRLTEFQQDPKFTLPLLELLKDDPELYVRRSVANHLADILKDHPTAAYKVCERWLREITRKDISPLIAKSRRWIIRHAVRLPAKKGELQALDLRKRAK